MIVKSVFESILKHERTEFLIKCKDKNKGNGYYERLVKGINKYLELKIPRDRLGLFKPVFLEALKNKESKMQDLAFKLYVKGLTTRDIEQIFDEIYGKKYSPTSISNITKEFQTTRETWLSRKLQKDYYFVYIDALWVSVRRDSVAKEAFYVAVGLTKELKREILGVYNIPQESSEGWRDVLKDLKNRGVDNILSIIADEINGLKNVIQEEFPSTLLQRCLNHKLKNVFKDARTKDKRALIDEFKEVFVLEDPNYTIEQGVKNLEKYINKWQKIYPYIKNKFKEENIKNYFAYLRFPSSIQRMIYTTNSIERLNKEIRRTEKVRNSFPNPDSAMNLICAALMDFEKRVYSYPVTAFLKAKDKLDELLLNNKNCHQTQNN